MASHAAARVLEIGTGSGCIAVTLALDFPSTLFTAGDVSGDALDVARENAERLGATRNLRFVSSDVYDGLDAGARFDVIVSNPPYVASADDLDESVREYEPMLALLADEGGTAFHRRIIEGRARLSAGGAMILEMAPEHADTVAALTLAAGAFATPEFHRDLSGKLRVAALTKLE